MRQGKLFEPAKREKTLPRQMHDFDKQNLRAAREILDEVEKHGGEGSGVVAWARTVVARIEANEHPNLLNGSQL